MDSVLTALKDTPIPTIIVVAGIVFLLLSIAGQLAGRINVPPERQRQAMIIGCLLVVVGVALHVVPPPKGDRPSQPSGTAVRMSEMEYGTNRFGSDYRSFKASEPQACRDTCAREAQCVAFTFVKAGVQGTTGVCWLKDRVSRPNPDTNCISGIKN
jgi:hypothetical protein